MRALANPRFRALLLVVISPLLLAGYLWHTLFVPIVSQARPDDFFGSYLPAVQLISAGHSPYCLPPFVAGVCLRPSQVLGGSYITPPLLAWALQPLLGLPAQSQLLVILAIGQISILVFLLALLRALKVHDRQLIVLIVLLVVAFEPVAGNFDSGQVNLVLLALSGVFLLAYVQFRSLLGGGALALAITLKLIQSPLVLLLLLRRRLLALSALAFTALILAWVAVPQYLLAYLPLLPTINAGTGLFENHSPGGTFTRLFNPASFAGASFAVPWPAVLLTYLTTIVVLILSYRALRRPRLDVMGRALEVSLVVAACPLVVSYSWGTHLVLLLLPMCVLVVYSLQARYLRLLVLVGLSWLLISVGHHYLQVLLMTPGVPLLVLRLLAEQGVLALCLLYAACHLALRHHLQTSIAPKPNPIATRG